MSLKDWLSLWTAAAALLFLRAVLNWPHVLDTLHSEALLIALATLAWCGGSAAVKMGRGHLALTTFVLTCPLLWGWALASPSVLLGPLTLLAGMFALLLVTGSSAACVLLNATVYLALCGLVSTELALQLACLSPLLLLPTLVRQVAGDHLLDRWQQQLANR